MSDFVRLWRISSVQKEETAKNVALDGSDRAILSDLSRNARTSYRKLAASAHLSPNATAERIRRLQTLGVIRGFHLDIDPSALGLNLRAFIDVKLQRGITMDAFEQTLMQIAGIEDGVSLTGAFDVRLSVICRDPNHLGELIEQLRAQGGVEETSATVIVRKLNLKAGGVRKESSQHDSRMHAKTPSRRPHS